MAHRSLLLSVITAVFGIISITSAVATPFTWDNYTKDGELAMNNGQWAAAEKLFSTALKEAEKSKKFDSRLGNNLYNLGELYRAQCNYAKAADYLSKAANVIAKVNDYPALRYAIMLNELADVYAIQKNYSKAEKLYKQEMSILEKVKGSDTQLINAFEDNAAMLYAQNKNAEAEKEHAKARALRLKSIN